MPYFTRYRGARCIALCNEHGKLERQPYNQAATVLWRAAMLAANAPPVDDYLAGPVVVLTGDDGFLAAL